MGALGTVELAEESTGGGSIISCSVMLVVLGEILMKGPDGVALALVVASRRVECLPL